MSARARARTTGTALSHWLARERVLLFSSGFQANLAAVSALADRHTIVLADRLIHHSLLVGCSQRCSARAICPQRPSGAGASAAAMPERSSRRSTAGDHGKPVQHGRNQSCAGGPVSAVSTARSQLLLDEAHASACWVTLVGVWGSGCAT